MALGLRDKAYDLCRTYLSGSWKTIKKDDMVFKAVSGGLTNVLFLCSLPSTHTPLNGEPSQVLMRMYGQMHTTNENDSPVTKITESVIFMMLSERNLGPKLYGIFPEGRLEEYISARALTYNELKDPIISAIIARKLANVHSLNVPINKEPTWLFDTMNDWLDKIKTLNVEQLYKNDKKLKLKQKKNPFNYKAAKFLLGFDFEKEIKWLQDFLKLCESPVVFCHNDAQEGNILIPDFLTSKNWSDKSNSDECLNKNRLINRNKNKSRMRNKINFTFNHHRCNSSPDALYDSGLVSDNIQSDDEDDLINDYSEEECSLNSEIIDEDIKFRTKSHYLKQLEEKMVLIDFEYCAYNYRGFDLANHFCEWLYDYSYDKYPHFKFNSDNYPTKVQLTAFVKEYLKHYCQGKDLSDCVNKKATAESLLNEITHFTLASHLLWTLWSINNAVNSQISFGYWEYGKCRLECYLKHKKNLLSLFKN